MPRIGRRGKTPKDSNKLKNEPPSNPSKILSGILKVLDLSFERDIGMLNGKSVRTVPDRKALVDLQSRLNTLDYLFKTISESDQKFVNHIRELRDHKNEQAKEKAKFTDATSVTVDPVTETTSTAQATFVKPELSLGLEKDILEKNDDKGEREDEIKEAKENNNNNGNDDDKKIEGDKKEETSINKTDEVDSRTLTVSNIDSSKNDTDNSNVASKIYNNDKANNEEKENDENSNDELSVPNKKRQLTIADDENDDDTVGNDLKRAKVEVDIDKMENDPSVKNPKSEFVVSQTLPKAASALGLFNEEGLETTGEESLKKKYGVASYPTNDLTDLLPGELPDMDYSCPKPTNQIQYNTFLSFVDNFFRELTDEDAKVLKSKYILPQNVAQDNSYDPNVTPFIIPKLGPLYLDTWLKEDNGQNLGNTSPIPMKDPTSILPRRSATELSDNFLESEDISCGPLASRLLSVILRDEAYDTTAKIATDREQNATGPFSSDIKEENAVDTSSVTDLESHDQTPSEISVHTPMSDIDFGMKLTGGTTSTLKHEQGWKINNINLDYPTFEERLKRELKYVGIYMNIPKDENGATGDDLDWLTGREDDEISAELRELQNSLKQVTYKNQNHKEALIPLLERQLAWQEYSSILDDLDKQIDQAYIKRIRVPKKRKKHHGNNSSGGVSVGTASQVAQQKAANSSLKSLLEKRQRWIKKIGPLFDAPEIMKRIPKESVFKDIEQEEEEEEGDVFGQTGDSKEEELGEN